MKIFAIGLIGATFLAPPQTFAPGTDGFIRNWLILAPIVFDVSGAEAIEHRFLDDEPATKPKPRESVVIINTPLTWQAHQAPTNGSKFVRPFLSQASRSPPTLLPTCGRRRDEGSAGAWHR